MFSRLVDAGRDNKLFSQSITNNRTNLLMEIRLETKRVWFVIFQIERRKPFGSDRFLFLYAMAYGRSKTIIFPTK